MALHDEHFYTNIYHGIPYEQKKTIKDNIIMLNEGSNLLNNIDNVISFASIWSGPIGKTGSRLISDVIDDLNKTGEKKLNEKIKIIVKNENSAELIKTLFETKYGQTPHIIMLSELVERQQFQINELTTKYDKQTISNMIDEHYNPRNLNEKAYLQDLVEEEMLSKGLDPLNKNDVQKYWKSKGIDSNG